MRVSWCRSAALRDLTCCVLPRRACPPCSGELNASVIVAPIFVGFKLESLGTPQAAAQRFLDTTAAPPGSDKTAQLLAASSRQVAARAYGCACAGGRQGGGGDACRRQAAWCCPASLLGSPQQCAVGVSALQAPDSALLPSSMPRGRCARSPAPPRPPAAVPGCCCPGWRLQGGRSGSAVLLL